MSTPPTSTARKRCPACGSRVPALDAACDMCGHVFGETRSIPKAEIQAAVDRERARVSSGARDRSKPITPRPSLAPPKQRRQLPWGVIGVVLAIGAIVAGGALLLSNVRPASPNAALIPTLVITDPGTGNAAPIAPIVNVTTPPQATPTQPFVYPTRTPLPPTEYTIVRNDTCGGIAQKFGLTLDEFLRYNGLNERSCTAIRIGDTLKIPPPSPTPGPTETVSPNYTPPPPATAAPFGDFEYEVKANDNCGQIAQQFQITVDALISANEGLNQQCLIRQGQKLKITRGQLAPTLQATAYLLSTPAPLAEYRAPGMLAPLDSAVVDDEAVTLEWLTAGTLRPNEWYVVQVQASGAITVPIFETKATSLRVTADLLGGQNEQTFVWWVQVRRKLDTMTDGTPVYNPLSPPSQARRFTWRRNAAPSATATR
jgi:LysM repeat protein